ncbi:MAG: hypothetical protein HY391_04810 [Deltaproteobacteria bacterium]|nr:hypothetical protein [Deltaproteobacteria bacterium]
MNFLTMRKQLLLMAALLSVGVVSGCGSDDGAGTPGPNSGFGPVSGVVFSNISDDSGFFDDNSWELQLGVAKMDNSAVFMSDGRIRVEVVLIKDDVRGQRVAYRFPPRDTYMRVGGVFGSIDDVVVSNGTQTVELGVTIYTIGDQRVVMGTAILSDSGRDGAVANGGFGWDDFGDDVWGFDYPIHFPYRSLTRR